MKLRRRQFLHLAAGAATLPLLSRPARPQAYPTRPVRIIVAAAAGGGTDVAARLIGQSLSERLGRSFLTENRPGGNNNIGYRGGRARARRRLYAADGQFDQCHQRFPLRTAQLRFHPRHGAGGAHRRPARFLGGQSEHSGEVGSRVHRLCEGQSGQTHSGPGRQERRTPLPPS